MSTRHEHSRMKPALHRYFGLEPLFAVLTLLGCGPSGREQLPLQPDEVAVLTRLSGDQVTSVQATSSAEIEVFEGESLVVFVLKAQDFETPEGVALTADDLVRLRVELGPARNRGGCRRCLAPWNMAPQTLYPGDRCAVPLFVEPRLKIPSDLSDELVDLGRTRTIISVPGDCACSPSPESDETLRISKQVLPPVINDLSIGPDGEVAAVIADHLLRVDVQGISSSFPSDDVEPFGFALRVAGDLWVGAPHGYWILTPGLPPYFVRVPSGSEIPYPFMSLELKTPVLGRDRAILGFAHLSSRTARSEPRLAVCSSTIAGSEMDCIPLAEGNLSWWVSGLAEHPEGGLVLADGQGLLQLNLSGTLTATATLPSPGGRMAAAGPDIIVCGSEGVFVADAPRGEIRDWSFRSVTWRPHSCIQFEITDDKAVLFERRTLSLLERTNGGLNITAEKVNNVHTFGESELEALDVAPSGARVFKVASGLRRRLPGASDLELLAQVPTLSNVLGIARGNNGVVAFTSNWMLDDQLDYRTAEKIPGPMTIQQAIQDSTDGSWLAITGSQLIRFRPGSEDRPVEILTRVKGVADLGSGVFLAVTSDAIYRVRGTEVEEVPLSWDDPFTPEVETEPMTSGGCPDCGYLPLRDVRAALGVGWVFGGHIALQIRREGPAIRRSLSPSIFGATQVAAAECPDSSLVVTSELLGHHVFRLGGTDTQDPRGPVPTTQLRRTRAYEPPFFFARHPDGRFVFAFSEATDPDKSNAGFLGSQRTVSIPLATGGFFDDAGVLHVLGDGRLLELEVAR